MVKALHLGEEIPSAPTSLKGMEDQFKTPLAIKEADPPSTMKPREPITSAAPVPLGYDPDIYNTVKKLADAKKDPTPQQLTALFRLMAFDSPFGELKNEALTVWRAMRAKGIRPTQFGYNELFRVSTFSFFVVCKGLWLVGNVCWRYVNARRTP